MPECLDYARPVAREKTGAVTAAVLGLLSGPIGMGLSTAFVDQFQHEANGWPVLLTLLVLPCGSFAFGCFTRYRMSPSTRRRDRAFANTGIAGSVVWMLAPQSFFIFVRHMLS